MSGEEGIDTVVILVRHGQTEWNKMHRIQGQTDVPLNDVGRDQAKATGMRLLHTDIDCVYSSDLSRALETAEIIVNEREHTLPIMQMAGLREMALGRLEGTYRRQGGAGGSKAREPTADVAAQLECNNEAETSAQFRQRVVESLRDIGRRCAGKTVLVVTHGGPLYRMLQWIGPDGMDGSVGNGAISEVHCKGGKWTVQSWDQ